MSILDHGSIGYQPRVGDTLEVYEANDNFDTLASLFTDESLNTSATNPVATVGVGDEVRWPMRFVSGTQKLQVRIKDSSNAIVYSSAIGGGFTIPDAVAINTAVENVLAQIAALNDRAFTENPIRNAGFIKTMGSQNGLSAGSYAETIFPRWFGMYTGTGGGTVSSGTTNDYCGTTNNYLNINSSAIGAGTKYFIRQRLESVRASAFVNRINVFSLNVRHTFGSDVTYTLTANKANAKDDFSSITQISTTSVTVSNDTDTRITSAAVNYGDCDNGLEFIVEIFPGSSKATSTDFAIADFAFDNSGVEIAYAHSHLDTEDQGVRGERGATFHSWDITFNPLEFGYKSARSYDQTNDEFNISFNAFYGQYSGFIPGVSTPDWAKMQTGKSWRMVIKDGGWHFLYSPSASAGAQIGSWQTSFYLTEEGAFTTNIQSGTGTLNCNSTLDINHNGSDLSGKTEIASSTIVLGKDKTSDLQATIDLVGDTTYTAYGLRIIREAGANGDSELIHRGTGDLIMRTVSSADIRLITNNSERVKVQDALMDCSVPIEVDDDGSLTTGLTRVESDFVYIGRNRTADGAATISFGARASVGTGYDYRIQRESGTNGDTNHLHTGTGNLVFNHDSTTGRIDFRMFNAVKFAIDNDGVSIGSDGIKVAEKQYGVVASDGTAVKLPSGWSSSRPGTGQFRVTHNQGLTAPSSNPVIVTIVNATPLLCSVVASANHFDVYIDDNAGTATNSAFNFSYAEIE